MKVPALKRRAISMLSLRDRSLLITGFTEWIRGKLGATILFPLKKIAPKLPTILKRRA